MSIRPGWFYCPDTDDEVKSLDELVEIYYGSVGRGSNLLLNVPVDRRDLIPYADSVRLMELAEVIRKSFDENLAEMAEVIVSSSRNNFISKNLVDDNACTYWASIDSLAEIELTFKEPVTFNRMYCRRELNSGNGLKHLLLMFGGMVVMKNLTSKLR